MMKKILIVYFSGVGATKTVAALIQNCILKTDQANLFSVENIAGIDLQAYDACVIGTPVYHGAPARKIYEFCKALPVQKRKIPAFLFHTKGAWACNTNRIMAKILQEKNVVTVLDRGYRAPASDGALLLPFVRRFYQYERDLPEHIASDVGKFIKMLYLCKSQGYLPAFRFASIWNAPNKFVGQHTTFHIHLLRERCIGCQKCIGACPHGALKKTQLGYPVFFSKYCENCYRCIHHCPQQALSLNRKRPPKKQLSDSSAK